MEEEAQQSGNTTSSWKPAQTYAMAAICLIIGVVVGYLLRGSAAPAPPPPAAAVTAASQPAKDPHAAMGQQKVPTLDDMKRMADKQADPFLTKLKADPKNVDLLNKTAVTYKASHQFKDAISYFQKALAIDPKNVPDRKSVV